MIKIDENRLNKRVTDWAYFCDTEHDSEVVQRVAFGFGYRWTGGLLSNTPIHLEKKYLVFYPDDKTICFLSDVVGREDYFCKLVLTIHEALETFKHPPVVGKKDKPKLPLVLFTYKAATYLKRRVLVIDYGSEYLTGLDCEDNNQFKQFRIDRINGPIVFLGFGEDQR